MTHTDMTRRIIDLYQPPFRFDGWFYIHDTNNEMVADFPPDPRSEDRGPFRVRGWGRIQKLLGAEKLFDATEEYLQKAVPDDIKQDPPAVVEFLNEHWRKASVVPKKETSRKKLFTDIAAIAGLFGGSSPCLRHGSFSPKRERVPKEVIEQRKQAAEEKRRRRAERNRKNHNKESK